MRILIFGNSGSGKSTYARALAKQQNLQHLDLDSIVWEPNQIAVQRNSDAIRQDLSDFTVQQDSWVIEGCYGELMQAILPLCTKIIFMNPGSEACIRNNSNRPWEPEKYASPEDQDRMLSNLIEWVLSYYSRNDAWSYAFHRDLFDSFKGDKEEMTNVPLL